MDRISSRRAGVPLRSSDVSRCSRSNVNSSHFPGESDMCVFVLQCCVNLNFVGWRVGGWLG